jgi:acetyltransferase
VNLDKLLRPRVIAVIGASERGGFGGDTCRNILDYCKDLDKVYFVNPRRDMVFGRKCYHTVSELPVDIDLAIICTPQAAVEDILREAARKGCGGAVVFASGYGECGGEGKAAQDRLTALCGALDIAVMGPNCAGFANYINDVYAFAFLTDKRDRTGNIGLVSQSGQICLSALDLPCMGFSYLISSGNSANVKVEEYFEFLVDDPDTRVIVAYIEGVSKIDVFVRALRKAAEKRKPVVILKAGRSSKARQLSVSHTGSLAGSDGAVNAIFEKYGVMRAEDIQDLLGTAAMFSTLDRLPEPGLLAALNVSGGEAGVTADMGHLYGLPFAEISPEIRTGLAAMMPSYCTPNNPLDMTATIAYEPDKLCEAIRLFMADKTVSAVMIDYTITQIITDMTVPCLVEGIAKAKSGSWCTKPILWLPFVEHSRAPEYTAKLRDLGVPVLPSGVYGVKSIRQLLDFVAYDPSQAAAMPALPVLPRSGNRIPHSEYESRELLKAGGFNVGQYTLVRSPGELAAAAERLGFPLLIKIDSRDILHKSDVGGVILDLKTPGELAAAYDELLGRIRRNCPGAGINGVLIAKMLDAGVEFIIGMNNDPQFGPMLMAGLGGVFVEIFKDVRLFPAPVTREQALWHLKQLRGYKLLDGYRGMPRTDTGALADLLARVSDYVCRHRDDLLELDINPVFVYPEGEGVAIADALLISGA